MIARADNADIIAGLSMLRVSVFLSLANLLLSIDILLHASMLLAIAGVCALLEAFLYRSSGKRR